jgi:sugar phosphate isomerase/epimerase
MAVAVPADNRFGLCWDTGHAYLAHIRGGEPVSPPRRFLAQVRHVHLHNVVDRRLDHMPLHAGTVPYRDHLEVLRSVGFAGDINVELHHRRCLQQGYRAEWLSDSAERVRAALP